jgi:hypothetical protein
MRYLFGFLCVCALGVVPLVGCGKGHDTCGEVGPGDCPCQRPLDHYCKGSDCPSWEQAIAAAEEFVQQVGDCHEGFGCFSEAGRCGDFRYVRTGCNIEVDATQYFDTSGRLIAATVCSDGCGDVCPGSCCVDYGFETKCELEQEQDFCDQND